MSIRHWQLAPNLTLLVHRGGSASFVRLISSPITVKELTPGTYSSESSFSLGVSSLCSCSPPSSSSIGDRLREPNSPLNFPNLLPNSDSLVRILLDTAESPGTSASPSHHALTTLAPVSSRCSNMDSSFPTRCKSTTSIWLPDSKPTCLLVKSK